MVTWCVDWTRFGPEALGSTEINCAAFSVTKKKPDMYEYDLLRARNPIQVTANILIVKFYVCRKRLLIP